MASADLSEELNCTICMEIYTDPITLPCGHSYCLDCITKTWNKQHERDASCPECRQRYMTRPELKINLKLRNIVECLHSGRPAETLVFCTNCIDSPVPAAKYCLHCEVFLCDNHVKVHSKSDKHVLSEPPTSLMNRKCSIHMKVLQYYCYDDSACICLSCWISSEHRGHQVEPLNEASEKKREKLKNVLETLISKRKKTEKRVQSLQESKREVQEKSVKVISLLLGIREKLEALEKQVQTEISKWEKQASLSVSDQIQQLEIKKDEMSRKIRHIEELCNTTDPLTVLQGQKSDRPEVGGTEEGGDEDIEGDDEEVPAADLDEDWISPTLHIRLTDIVTYVHKLYYGQELTKRDVSSGMNNALESRVGSDRDKSIKGTKGPRIPDLLKSKMPMSGGVKPPIKPKPGQYSGGYALTTKTPERPTDHTAKRDPDISSIIPSEYGQLATDMVMDINTAGNYVEIEDKLKTASATEKNQCYQQSPERFENNQVLSTSTFTSGQHYWDVDASKYGAWRVGVAYSSIPREIIPKSYLGQSFKSWCLCQDGMTTYLLRHDRDEIPLSVQPSCKMFRISLDYEAGRLSFYELCDPIRHLHTFNAIFTEPLHAAFNVECDARVTIRV